MSINEMRLQSLFDKFVANNCTREELQELYDYYTKSGDEQLYALMDKWYRQMPLSANANNVDWDHMFAGIVAQGEQQPVRKTGAGIFTLRRVAAAAIVVLLLGSGWFFFYHSSPPATPLVTQEKPPKTNIGPGGNKAVLTLANGRQITLDNAQNGMLAREGTINVVKTDSGRLSYQLATGGPASGIAGYNTLSTPRGGQYQLELPDGSRVWLNAASSIKYPSAFTGAERVVEITGEAYFEVAPLTTPLTPKGGSKKVPFIVRILPASGSSSPLGAGGGEVEVLGTHFNINAYGDELVIRTTLLEGSVQVRKGTHSGLLKPGEQAQLSANGSIDVVKNTDVSEAVAWKNGIFQFDHAGIDEVMRQLARWYDVDIVYEKGVPAMQFGGKMQRNLYLGDVLEILEKEDVHFKIDGKKIIVLP